MTETVTLLLDHYRQASPEAREAGARWYREARREARRIAREAGVTLSVAAGVMAALSPRVTWSQNVRMARAACLGQPYGALGTSVRAASRILAGEKPTDVLNGPKVRAFYQAIMGHDVAVVDVWMVRAMGLDRHPTRAQYPTLAAAITTAAAAVGISTAVFQATVWTVVRGTAA